MQARAFLLAGTFFAAAALPAQVRVTVKDGRPVISNDGPANLGASDSWLAARVKQPSAYDGLIEAAAVQNDVDPRLVKSVMLIESGFNPAAISKKGARGLMQLMPEIAAEQGVRDVHDPKQNIDAGTRELSRLLLNYRGDLVRSLAAYNAGEAAVERYAGVPPYAETQLYVHKALAAYRGGSELGGGFGIPTSQTYRGHASKGKPVQWTRDARTNRVILTTKSAPRRLG
ncbi:MAG TPA: lytic transglycosylase domain-containing protein [Thermoanaerobaculia bacterium]|nr:lytic transglycosylase domain-containing protein [Thermoanaerobaculia bacterium]